MGRRALPGLEPLTHLEGTILALVDWYIATLYENGIKTAWLRNAQQRDDETDQTPALGREYYYANISQVRTARLKFVTRQGDISAYEIPPEYPGDVCKITNDL